MDEETKLFEAYKIAINARNTTYDNLHKWMTFYYVAVGAIFIAYYTISDDKQIKILLTILGFITSVVWHLSCKGYYFWILNWINVIGHIENKLPETMRVYFIFSEDVEKDKNDLFNPRKPANISTAKITIFFSLLIAITWAFLFFHVCCDNIQEWLIQLVCAILATMAIIFFGRFFTSDLKQHIKF